MSHVELIPDHQPFLSDRFDVHDYANAVIQGRAYRPDDAEAAAAKTEKGDLGVEVARLNYAIDDVTRQLRQEVSGFKATLAVIHRG